MKKALDYSKVEGEINLYDYLKKRIWWLSDIEIYEGMKNNTK